ncbi:hypothetical protein sr12664 [Sporisorium reilianum SRZ2]|uniref:Uncharacterized protein n=1 Tax=Sporisorium reilianum (strain SRZ2) TaxID=999809 RepID=E6ZX51_SPORE|nr:hypothetical protein sr12664 [Sporisorium reilianum SRZ2]
MHSNAHIAIPPIPASSSVTVLDSDQLLHLLLRSIPSSQGRSDLGPLKPDNARLAHQSSFQPPLNPASATRANSAMPSTGDDPAPRGVLTKLGFLFTKLSRTCIKIEDQDPLLDKVKSEPEAHVKLEAPEADELKEEIAQVDLTADDEDSEMEVEYMIIAEKCITVGTPTSSVNTNRTDRHTARPNTKTAMRQHWKKSRTSRDTSSPTLPSVLLNSPPVIKRRRQINRVAKPKRKQRAVPGFH